MSMNTDIAIAKTQIDTDLQGIQVGDISFSNGKKLSGVRQKMIKPEHVDS